MLAFTNLSDIQHKQQPKKKKEKRYKSGLKIPLQLKRIFMQILA